MTKAAVHAGLRHCADRGHSLGSSWKMVRSHIRALDRTARDALAANIPTAEREPRSRTSEDRRNQTHLARAGGLLRA